jgi:hypothetical protein
MIFRAIFFIAAVSVLMPREPNLGFGRPDAQSVSALIPQVSQALGASGQNCQGAAMACAIGLNALNALPAMGLRPLSAVKADIDAAVRERKTKGG